MVSEHARRRESGGTITKVFDDNRHRRKRWNKGKRDGVGAKNDQVGEELLV